MKLVLWRDPMLRAWPLWRRAMVVVPAWLGALAMPKLALAADWTEAASNIQQNLTGGLLGGFLEIAFQIIGTMIIVIIAYAICDVAGKRRLGHPFAEHPEVSTSTRPVPEGEAAQAAAATPSPELPPNSPEGWSAWPLWRRAMVVVPAWLGAITGLIALLLTR